MTSICNLKMEKCMKLRNFKATIKPMVLYGSECWTIDSIPTSMFGYYIRLLLRMATNISWKDNITYT